MNELTISKEKKSISAAMESVLIDGDLSKLSAEQRVTYYNKVCESVGLNPLTRPFEYQRFNGKLSLYARKEAAEQLRFIHKVSIYRMDKETIEGVCVVTSYAKTADGREDVAVGAVNISNLKGEALANGIMKAETKSKRRVTLSICGLGMLDETEIGTFPGSSKANVNVETGEIIDHKNEIGVPRADLIAAILAAGNLNDLKNAYADAYRVHVGNLEIMKDITELKDRRKAYLEGITNDVHVEGNPE